MAKAAHELSVSEATVSRRVLSMEAALGARLFDRSTGGHTPTEVGEAALRIAARVAQNVSDFRRAVEGADQSLTGTIVLTTTGPIYDAWLAAIVADFCVEFPEIAVEVRESNTLENLYQRAADVALRVCDAPDGGLVGRRVARLAYATYASSKPGARRDRWVGWTDRAHEKEWKQGPFEDLPVHHRVSTAGAALSSVREGLGVARLECYLGDADPALERIDGAHFERWIWLLTHEGLRRTARVRVFLDFLFERMREDKRFVESDADAFRTAERPTT